MTGGRRPDPGGPDDDLRRRFDEFYKATAQRTFHAACRVARGDIEVAKDATQEAYLTMLRIWAANGESIQDSARYVVGVAVNKVVDHYRRQARYEALTDEDPPQEDDTAFEQVVSRIAVIDMIRKFLDSQAPRQRAVGVLYFLEGFSYAEICAALEGISQSTARTHVQRLRLKLIPIVRRITHNGEEGGGRS
jgi:RNA polymerase sigma factor (sigma-70 family)